MAVSYRYDADGELVYRGEHFEGSGPVDAERYVVEEGRRTMTLDGAGKVARRYEYGAVDELLWDEAFNAAGQETSLLLPLGDHQNSTRLVLHHDAANALQPHQSIDYAQFGRVTAIRDAAGALVEAAPGTPNLAALDTVFGHHGSVTDAKTGLQHKSRRWYSPDLGRFLSEDPIQHNANWYVFAGNDPNNTGDPTGLFQQGHPLLAGGFSGGPKTSVTVANSGVLGGLYVGGSTASPVRLGALAGSSAPVRGTAAQIVNSGRSSAAASRDSFFGGIGGRLSDLNPFPITTKLDFSSAIATSSGQQSSSGPQTYVLSDGRLQRDGRSVARALVDELSPFELGGSSIVQGAVARQVDPNYGWSERFSASLSDEYGGRSGAGRLVFDITAGALALRATAAESPAPRTNSSAPSSRLSVSDAGIDLTMYRGTAAPSSSLRVGQAGRFSDLDGMAVVGDNLTPHHMPQAALGFTSRAEGGAIMMPHAEHVLTRTYGSKGARLAMEEAGTPFRTVLARDIRDVRSVGGREYNPGSQSVIEYYRRNFPDLMAVPK